MIFQENTLPEGEKRGREECLLSRPALREKGLPLPLRKRSEISHWGYSILFFLMGEEGREEERKIYLYPVLRRKKRPAVVFLHPEEGETSLLSA